MESKIIKQEKNPFLERDDLILEITHDSTPSLEDVKSEIGRDSNLTVIKKINTNFGKRIFLVEAVVYNNIEAKEKIETVPQKVRKKIEAEKKAAEEAKAKEVEAAKKVEEEAKVAEAEASAEGVKEETPIEETKEGVKSE